ncbi:coenzyme F420-0:L-glutamate ligase [Denitratisoma sp. DHT3]|uniref:coenzyme F420-0:L-glutamate ligase n=1 Tax=Denitratisoma sp. DHT3 TaxID=1981880 RepID=UPI0011986956|nr:coenzyme F420-0:L-glutamate ligase [Denitratisoma sp. DHT3]QDX82155.1 coenzyme F420-0:L-glutamate ligase [Denitratisoma sp. DHT3]
MTASISFTALPGIGEIRAGDDLAGIACAALARIPVQPRERDVLIVAQKVVSKSEGRLVQLADVSPSPRALELAAVTGKDPRVVELVLAESREVLRAKTNVLIVRHRCGFVMANAGIDRSNVEGADVALLLPLDADASAAALRDALRQRLGCDLGVIVSDSFGRAWRHGVVNVALGCAGLPALIDRRGEADRHGRILEVTQVAYADAIAAGAALAMGEGAEGTPMVLARGLSWSAPDNDGQALIRPLEEDMFQ